MNNFYLFRNNLHKKTSSLSKYNFFSEESDSSLKNQTLQDSISTVDPSLNGSSYNPNYSFQDAFIRHSSLPNSGRIQHSGKVEVRTLSRVPEPGKGWGALGTDLGRVSTPSREPYPVGRKEKNQYYRFHFHILVLILVMYTYVFDMKMFDKKTMCQIVGDNRI